MPKLYLEFQIYAGSDIENVAKELIDLASKLNITCMAIFNGVKITAHPGTLTTYKDIVNYYKQKQKQNNSVIETLEELKKYINKLYDDHFPELHHS